MERLRRKAKQPVQTTNPNRHLLDLSRYTPVEYRSSIYRDGMLCWNCCHPFSGEPVGIPSRVDGAGVYYTYGNFCGYPCALRYIRPDTGSVRLEYLRDIEIDSGDSAGLLQTMYMETSGLLRPIHIAPPRLSLSAFGGFLQIDEYRGTSSTGTPATRDYGYTITRTLL